MRTTHTFWKKFFNSFFTDEKRPIIVRPSDSFRVIIDDKFIQFEYFVGEMYEEYAIAYSLMKTKLPTNFADMPAPMLFALHEVGHVKTENIARDILLNANRVEIEKDMYESLNAKEITLIEFGEVYRELPDEKVADEWAYHYIANHSNKVEYWIARFNEIYHFVPA